MVKSAILFAAFQKIISQTETKLTRDSGASCKSKLRACNYPDIKRLLRERAWVGPWTSSTMHYKHKYKEASTQSSSYWKETSRYCIYYIAIMALCLIRKIKIKLGKWELNKEECIPLHQREPNKGHSYTFKLQWS